MECKEKELETKRKELRGKKGGPMDLIRSGTTVPLFCQATPRDSWITYHRPKVME